MEVAHTRARTLGDRSSWGHQGGCLPQAPTATPAAVSLGFSPSALGAVLPSCPAKSGALPRPVLVPRVGAVDAQGCV